MESRLVRQVPATLFSRTPGAFVDQVFAGGERIVVTRNGKPRAMLVPFTEDTADQKGLQPEPKREGES